MPTPFDVAVVGGGPGGVTAAVRASQLGAKVALIEEKNLGGACMNKACIPFAHMMRAASLFSQMADASKLGIKCHKIAHDFKALSGAREELVGFLRAGLESLLKKNKIEVIRGKASILNAQLIGVEGASISAGRLILATGAEWAPPPSLLKGRDKVVSTDDLLKASRLPKSCLILAESPPLITVAQILSQLGAKVTIVTKGKSILPEEDRAIRSRLTKALQRQGLQILTGKSLIALDEKKGGSRAIIGRETAEHSIEVEMVVGGERISALQGLGLEAIGLDEGAWPLKVNDQMETEAAGIYAVGDLVNPPELHYSHLATAQGLVAAENAMGISSTYEPRLAARVVFTRPQAACVGLTAAQAKKKGYDVVVGAAPLSMNPLGMIMDQQEGLVELVAEREYGEILGIHIVAEHAAEMAALSVALLKMEATLEELSNIPLPHPTLGESVCEAAREALGRPILIP